jgi:hypothetical protein
MSDWNVVDEIEGGKGDDSSRFLFFKKLFSVPFALIQKVPKDQGRLENRKIAKNF